MIDIEDEFEASLLIDQLNAIAEDMRELNLKHNDRQLELLILRLQSLTEEIIPR